jgi:hypothetical protein
VIQEAPARFRVRLVAGPACDRVAVRARLGDAFRAEFAAGVAVDVEFCDALARPAGGKPRVVIPLRAPGGVADAALDDRDDPRPPEAARRRPPGDGAAAARDA